MQQKNRNLWVYSFSIAFCAAMLAARILYTGKYTYLFLVWNLFLGALPLWFSTLAGLFNKKKIVWAFWVCACLWFLFFPNAPYILTDLFHLKERHGLPKWFDLLLLLSFAWSGLHFGLRSLKQMQEIVSKKYAPAWSWLFVYLAMLAAGFGVYIGRYLRWNSWEVFSHPLMMSKELLDIFLLKPDKGFYIMAFLFSLFLLMVYLAMDNFANPSDENEKR